MKAIHKKLFLAASLALCLEQPAKAVEPFLVIAGCSITGAVIAYYLTDSEEVKTRNSLIGAAAGFAIGLTERETNSDGAILRRAENIYNEAFEAQNFDRYPIGTKLPLTEALQLLEQRLAHDKKQQKKLRSQLRILRQAANYYSYEELKVDEHTSFFDHPKQYTRLINKISSLNDQYVRYIDKLELALGELRAELLTNKTAKIIRWDQPERIKVLSGPVNPN